MTRTGSSPDTPNRFATGSSATRRIDQAQAGRADLSEFVVHFTRDLPGSAAVDNLVSILGSGCIEARNPHGFAKARARRSPAIAASQSAVCFSEAPWGSLRSLVEPIEGRQNPLTPFGIAFAKNVARERGVNPVWYFEVGGPIEVALQRLFELTFAARRSASVARTMRPGP